jgi:hypothetical protein
VCSGGEVVPEEPVCTDMPVEPECALVAPNARLEVTVAGTSYVLEHAYVQHGVGFATYAALTFTTDGNADVCTTRRLTVALFGPTSFDETDGAYDGEHEARVQLTDEALVPPYRFGTGRLVITESLPFRAGGPLTGSLEVRDEDLTVRGTFTAAAECEPWRTSGS